MQFTFVTLFPSLIEGYFSDSILKRAIENNFIKYQFYNPRNYSLHKHQKVDTPAIGGGAGMVMSNQPLFDCLADITNKTIKPHFIFTTPVAKTFNQNDAKRLSKKENIVFISGRYEGIDERVIEMYADEVFSIGDYILTGGELPSLIMMDAISRNIKGVLGNSSSLEIESFENLLLEAPSFAKPKNFREKLAPSELLKGNHSRIANLKIAMSECKTKFFRPKRFISYKTYEK
jgi:tRNA (guanine37-N1)-methyltransferase